MTPYIKFQNLTLVKNGIVLRLKNKELKEISYFDIERVYLKVYNLKPFQEFLLVTVPILITLLFVIMYSTIYILIISAFLILLLILIKVKTYKKYRLNLQLKNGNFYIKNVSYISKVKDFNSITEIKKAKLGLKKNNILL